MASPFALKILALCWVGVGLLAYGVASLPGGARAWPYIAIHCLLGALMLGIWRGCASPAARCAAPVAAAAGKLWLQSTLGCMILAGIVLRLALVGVPAFTSNDMQRYLWDGAVLLAGFDPYVLPPNHPELASLRARWPTPAEHVALPTIYPPLALGLFAAASVFGPHWAPWVWKLLLALGSLSMLLLGWRLLVKVGREQHVVLLALSPLVVLEGGVGAHLDVLVGAALAWVLLCMVRQRWWLAGIAVGLATLLKLWPLLLLWPLLSLAGWRGRWQLLLLCAATVMLGYGAALWAGLQPLGSLPHFLQHWAFGSPIGSLLAMLDGYLRWLVVLVVLGVGAIVVVPWVGRGKLFAASFWWCCLPFLLGPVVFPWYLLPLVVLLVLAPTYVGIFWTLALPFTYEVIDAFDAVGTWQPASWPLALVGAAWAVGLLLDRLHGCGSGNSLGDCLVGKDSKELPNALG